MPDAAVRIGCERHARGVCASSWAPETERSGTGSLCDEASGRGLPGKNVRRGTGSPASSIEVARKIPWNYEHRSARVVRRSRIGNGVHALRVEHVARLHQYAGERRRRHDVEIRPPLAPAVTIGFKASRRTKIVRVRLGAWIELFGRIGDTSPRIERSVDDQSRRPGHLRRRNRPPPSCPASPLAVAAMQTLSTHTPPGSPMAQSAFILH